MPAVPAKPPTSHLPPPTCSHCGLPAPPGSAFCCTGCAAAHALLIGCGLGDFYRQRADAGPGAAAADEPAAEAFDSEAFRAAHARRLDGGGERMVWLVAGIHCPACVWLLERLPRILPGVRAARLDLAAGSLTVDYDPAQAPPGAQARTCAGLGYRLRPYARRAALAQLRGERRALLLRLAVAAASAVGAMHLSANLVAGELTGDLGRAEGSAFAWLALAAALPAATWSAASFWTGAWQALRRRRWSVDATAALAIAVGMGASVWAATRGGGGSAWADAVAMFICLLLAARLALLAARERLLAEDAALAGLLPPSARLADGRQVPPASLAPGDLVLVEAGGTVPADGTVEDAPCAVGLALLTGESRPVRLLPGQQAPAGARAADALRLRVTAAGEDTRLARLLAGAQAAAAPRDADAADRLQAWFVPAVLAVALAIASAWWRQDAVRAVELAVAALLVSCPCAIGLAVPLVQARAAALLARRGILLREPGVLAGLDRVGHVVVDKTGTLTTGVLAVRAWEWLPGADPAALAPLIAEAESRSRHPAAAAVAAHLGTQPPAALAAWREEPGLGVVAGTALGELRIGGARLTGVEGPGIAATLAGRPVARVRFDDPLRPEAAALVRGFEDAGAAVHLCSGDDPGVTAMVGGRLGLEPSRVHGGMAPEDKAGLVRRLRQDGRGVLVLGDGLNDAPACAAATIAIGLRGGLEAAVERCHVFCARPDQAGPAELLATARAAAARIRLILAVSLAYNAAALALVAGGVLGPLVCAVAMPLSSATAVALALGWRGRRA